MRYKFLSLLTAVIILFSCKKEYEPIKEQSPAEQVPVVLLKDIEIPHLPSPFYHFEYNAEGKVTGASFASGLTMYNVVYNGGRIIEMKNNIVVNKDRIQYFYDNDSRVNAIQFADSTGIVFRRSHLTYDEKKLIKIVWERKSGADFIFEKSMEMIYQADGNLQELTHHHPPMNGQDATTYTDHFGQYDTGINVDGFSLLHQEFFEHLILLPGVQLQKNNPRTLLHTGDGINYKVDYNYTYNDKNLPLAKTGEFLYLNGSEEGQRYPTSSVFSYY